MNHPLDLRLLPSTWHACLRLGFEHGARGTVLRHCTHTGPLYVQKAFYPEGRDVAHAYLLHPPGGMVSGDHLEVLVSAAPHSHVLVTTPGAGRVYRALVDRSLQHLHNHIEVAEQATVEWLPLETIVYPDAQASLNTHFNLQAGAKCIAWDVISLGLPASAQPFSSGSLQQTMQVHIQGRLALRERMLLDRQSRDTSATMAGFQGKPVAGLMIAGPFDIALFTTAPGEQLEAALQALCSSTCEGDLAASTVVGQFVVLRYLGHCSNRARQLFTRCWQQLRPALLNRPACEPRIWRT